MKEGEEEILLKKLERLRDNSNTLIQEVLNIEKFEVVIDNINIMFVFKEIIAHIFDKCTIENIQFKLFNKGVNGKKGIPINNDENNILGDDIEKENTDNKNNNESSDKGIMYYL